ncbi:MAG: phosphonate transport system permease protein [Phormidesmis priestleyi Ana]|uniref:Phosphonate transport system permease protein n=1 Tax=Phormidesmis priestleyi Ana TaxID=1666911 RepID=A0A0P7ZZA2_9CYAN|nr:MAG: phosphonate transport system permease protein [Phormidesmis priestleyi Ana]
MLSDLPTSDPLDPQRVKSLDALPDSTRSHRRRLAVGLWIALVIWALWLSGLGRSPLINWAGLPLMGQFWAAMLRPDLTPEFVGMMARAAVTTLAFAVCGTVLSLGVGFVTGIFCSLVWWRVFWPGRSGRIVWLGLRGLLVIPRAIHELIWGLLLLGVLGLDPIVGVLAIAIPFGAITGKVFSEILDETPTGPLDALVNSGVNPGIAFLYGLLPQALPNLISYGFYRFECSLRSAAVLGVIGAGGVGYQIFLSLQSLRYEQLWTGFYVLIVLNGAVDFWSGWLRRQMGFVGRLDLAKGRETSQPLTNDTFKQKGRLVWLAWGAIALAVPLCFAYLEIDWSRWGRVRSLLAEMAAQVTPDRVLPQFSWSLLPLSLQTMAMSVLAITLAGLGGIVFSFPAAQNFFLPGGLLRSAGESRRWSVGHGAMLLARLLLLGARAIPAPIFALVILYGMFPSILPGALALGLHNFGILGRLMAEVNENLPDGPVRALRSLGASAGSLVFYGILPANLARFLAYGLYRWEVCLRETVIVGLVGAGGLGRLLTEQLSGFDYSGLAATLSVFIALTMLVDAISGWMRSAAR